MSESKEQPRPAGDIFYDAFRSSPIGIVLEDLEGRVLFVNPAFCSMLGFSEEEMLSKHCVDFSPAEDAAKDWALFQQLRAGSIDHYHLDKRYFRRDGSLVWGRLSISLTPHPQSPLVIAMVEDITEKMLAEAELQRHAAIVKSTDDAIFSRTPDGIILSWNNGAQNLFGYTEAEAIGRPITIIVPDELHEEAIDILNRVRNGEHIQRYETVRMTKEGKR